MAEPLALLFAGLVGAAVGALAVFLLTRAGLAGREQEVRAAIEARAEAEARARASANEIDRLRSETEAARGARDVEVAARATAEREAALARQAAEEVAKRLADWETAKTEFLKSAQVGVLASAQQISTKLIEDHQRETAAAQAQAKQATEGFEKNLTTLTDGLSQLKGQLAEKAETLETVVRALSSPAGAGQFAELGLANTLTSFGLVEGRDFVLQATIHDAEGGRKRPDALVFLPGDAALVVDAKASKHLLALAEFEGTEQEAEAYRGLARTMNQHLKDLMSRDYDSAVRQGWKGAGRSAGISRLLTIMYLPNEAALEKLGRADPDFPRRAAEAQIVPAGPAGLACIIGFASVEIGLMRQVENQERIAEAAGRLIESLGVALGHFAGVGKGIRGAAEAYGKLAGSFNARVLPRAKEMVSLGVRAGSKPLPVALPVVQVLEPGGALIEGEAVDADPALPSPDEI
jgi:DNA recombination protein RmuC